MNAPLPTSIPGYLDQLRRALAGADSAMIHDALHDAEEYLRSELADNPGKSEAEVIAAVASSYGAPDEVAEIYRDTEVTVQRALRPPVPRARSGMQAPGWLRRVFGVFSDPRTYGALFYMLLALATGIFYFTWTVTGASLSLGLSVLIIGLPFLLLFLGASRVLSLVEGRIVEVMLGERMPRRVAYQDKDRPWLKRIGDMFADPRTWSTFLYFMLMLPLGIIYFTTTVALLSSGLALTVAPLLAAIGAHDQWQVSVWGIDLITYHPWVSLLFVPVGIAVIVATFHLARAIGRMHGHLAKALLVKGD